MPSEKTLQEVWRWKEEVARETAGMTAQELVAYYRKAEQRLAEKTGRMLDLNRLARQPRRSKETGR
jgi:hypothetical protein